ncbi:hypothetical protein [Buchnera aphidicola]|uniref:Uncharacterized protein n=1 Tax=Buchnera aphidicola (Aphis aurantii) TaxID=1470492 RepID=A0AAU6W6K9_9GAMM
MLNQNNNSEENTNIILLNFTNTVDNIITEISHDKNIFFSKKISLYINTLRNKSNIFLENKKLTNIIKHHISKKINTFSIINQNQINKTKKKLGLSENNEFINTSTAMLLARNNQAIYYIDSSIIQNNQLLLLKIKLILVQTGEIIFQKTKNFYFL